MTDPHVAGRTTGRVPGRVTGLVSDPVCALHDTGSGHPERATRLAAVLERLAASGLAAELERVRAPEATHAMLERVHAAGYPAELAARIASGARVLEGNTTVSRDSTRAALAAAGGAALAVERVLDGTWSNAFCALRPPGHHAEAAQAMGFCLFNNAAVAARHAQTLGIERVAILDWDVHHGNGTQHVFERDPSVFFASLHQWPLYPGTGRAEERGLGPGEGATLNCPLAPGSGDVEWIKALEGRVLPALDAFGPELLIVSAGFDAHHDDPLGGARVTTAGFARMSEIALAFARERCGGRLVSMLEGGYDLGALAASAEAHVAALRA